MTRLATSDWAVWADVLRANGDLAVAPLTALVERLTAARDALASDDHQRLRQVLGAHDLVATVR